MCLIDSFVMEVASWLVSVICLRGRRMQRWGTLFVTSSQVDMLPTTWCSPDWDSVGCLPHCELTASLLSLLHTPFLARKLLSHETLAYNLWLCLELFSNPQQGIFIYAIQINLWEACLFFHVFIDSIIYFCQFYNLFYWLLNSYATPECSDSSIKFINLK
jgi:hypothetical protein